jgi:hypothetical protein
MPTGWTAVPVGVSASRHVVFVGRHLLFLSGLSRSPLRWVRDERSTHTASSSEPQRYQMRGPSPAPPDQQRGQAASKVSTASTYELLFSAVLPVQIPEWA